jgi:hypothetical protein
MQHPYYTNPDQFQPKTSSIENWLKTRKNGSANKPGIFETVDYSRDQIWSISSFAIELLALYFTFFGAYTLYLTNEKIGVIIAAIFVALSFILLDIFGIMLHGYDKPEKVKNRSLYIVTKDTNLKLEIYTSLKETTWKEFVGFMFLSVSAVLKIAALWYFLQESSLYLLVIFTILYIVVIYIHAYHTVYWWPAFKLNRSISKQLRNFNELYNKGLPTEPSNTVSNTISFPFSSTYIMSLGSIQTCANGRINVVSNGDGSYTLNVRGILWDENIVQLLSKWGQQNSDDLINACITVQLMQNNVIV